MFAQQALEKAHTLFVLHMHTETHTHTHTHIHTVILIVMIVFVIIPDTRKLFHQVYHADARSLTCTSHNRHLHHHHIIILILIILILVHSLIILILIIATLGLWSTSTPKMALTSLCGLITVHLLFSSSCSLVYACSYGDGDNSDGCSTRSTPTNTPPPHTHTHAHTLAHTRTTHTLTHSLSLTLNTHPHPRTHTHTHTRITLHSTRSYGRRTVCFVAAESIWARIAKGRYFYALCVCMLVYSIHSDCCLGVLYYAYSHTITF